MATDTVVRISQAKLAELILARIRVQMVETPGMEIPAAEHAANAFASAMYQLWAEPSQAMSDEDALTGLAFMAEAFESVAGDLVDAHFTD